MLSLPGRLTPGDLFKQAWNEVQQSVLGQLRRTIEGLLSAERDRRVAEARARGDGARRGHAAAARRAGE
jgi:hypothetical protein